MSLNIITEQPLQKGEEEQRKVGNDFMQQQQIIFESSHKNLEDDDNEDEKLERHEIKEQIQKKEGVDISNNHKHEQSEKSKQLKNHNKKRKVDMEGYSSFDSEEYNENNQIYGNVHGFINPNVIDNFKDKRSEARKKIQEARNGIAKEKWYQGPKEKGGGLTNKKKLKNKPLEMLRPKKNQETILTKKSKLKIKILKQQVGHFQSGKHKKTGKKIIKRY